MLISGSVRDIERVGVQRKWTGLTRILTRLDPRRPAAAAATRACFRSEIHFPGDSGRLCNTTPGVVEGTPPSSAEPGFKEGGPPARPDRAHDAPPPPPPAYTPPAPERTDQATRPSCVDPWLHLTEDGRPVNIYPGLLTTALRNEGGGGRGGGGGGGEKSPVSAHSFLPQESLRRPF